MKSTKFRLPDIINLKTKDRFTQISNDMLKNPNLSFKAKGLLSLLLSNNEGWYSYINTLQKMSIESETSIKSGLNELEKQGYLIRLRYRDKISKQWQGTLWGYSDQKWDFDLRNSVRLLNKQGFELCLQKPNPLYDLLQVENPQLENLYVENLKVDLLSVGNRGLIILYINKTNNSNKTNINKIISNNNFLSGVNPDGNIKERNELMLPYCKKLYDIISTKMKIKRTMKDLKMWSVDFRQMVENDNISTDRINAALDWYEINIGGQYIPVIESGKSFRTKFIKLEAAMERSNKPKPGLPRNGAIRKTKVNENAKSYYERN